MRANISGLARLPAAVVEPGLARLRSDLASGAWQARNAGLLGAGTYDAGYRLVVAGG